MKKAFVILSLSLCIGLVFFSCTQKTMPVEGEEYSIESAQRFMEMARQAMDGTQPTDEDWRALFATKGYHTFFQVWNWTDSTEWQRNIRNGFDLAFNPARKAQLDSIVARPLGEESSDEDFFTYNFYLTKQRFNELYEFIHTADFGQVMQQAHERVLQFLPAGADTLDLPPMKCYYLAFDPEGRTGNGVIFYDYNTAFEDGPEGLVNGIAHELHHQYMGLLMNARYHRDCDDAALQAIVRNQLEGAADLINKGTMPTDKLGAYGPDIVKMYNDDYFDSPNVLRQLDSLTCGYLAGKLDAKQYQAAAGCAHFEGHTTGDYMVFLIRDQLGQQAAIDCLGDFSAFVQRYNEAARKADAYVFSETFVSHIDSICSDLQTGE